MRIHSTKERSLRSHSRLAIWLVAAVLVSVAGCGSFTTLTESSKSILADRWESDGKMRKKVGLATFGLSTFSLEYSPYRSVRVAIGERLAAKCRGIIVVAPDDKTYEDVLGSPPRYASGKINNFQLTQQGRPLGLNAIVTGDPVEILEEIEETGMLWFKDTASYARLNVSVDVYDTSTGAKLLGENIIRKIEVDAAGLEKVRTRDYGSVGGLAEVLREAAAEAADKICKAVEREPWKGYLIAVDGNRVSISSGRNTGLDSGDRLGVYPSRRTLESTDGQRFYLPETKAGEISVTSLTPDRAEAVLVSGGGFSEGDLVMRE